MPQFSTGHIGLNVQDVEKTKQFYENIFGFKASYSSAEEGRKFTFLNNDEGLILTLWQQSSGRFATDRAGLHHLSFEVAHIDEIVAIETKLRESAIPIIYDSIVPHGEGQNSAAIYFEDPDGIRLEVYTLEGGKEYTAPTPDAPSCGFF